MSIRTQLTQDLKAAMKAGDGPRKLIIREAMSAFKEEEQTRREKMTRAALEKHNVSRPVKKKNDTDEMYNEALAAYDKAIHQAMAAENVEEAANLDDDTQLTVIQRLIKQHQDSIDDAKKADRPEMVEENEAAIEILQAYLPEQLSREEIEAEAKAIIEQMGVTDMREMGKVMGPLMGKLKGQADGKLISEVVRSLLSE